MSEPVEVKREPAERGASPGAAGEPPQGFPVKEELDVGPIVLQPTDLRYLMMSPKPEPAQDNTRSEVVPRLVLERLPTVRCGDCGGVFLSPAALRRHAHATHGLRSESGAMPRLELERVPTLACGECDGVFLTPAALRMHSRTTHYKRVPDLQKTRIFRKSSKTNRIHKCKVCKKAFSEKYYLTRHMRTHQEDRPFECDICGKTFKELDAMRQHRRAQHTDRRVYQCDYCQRTMAHRTTLLKHISNHTKGRGFCDLCNDDFLSVNTLKKHMRKCHSELRVYQCKHCKQKFKEKEKYDAHMRQHRKEPLKCNICNIALQNGKVREHMKTHNAGLLYQCEYCKKTYINKFFLNEHILVHTQKQAYCSICQRDCVSKRGIYFHRKKYHTGLQFTCDVCKKIFPTKYLLRRHIFIYHSKERPFECYICNQKFKQKGVLVRHMNIHTLARTYQCDYCKKVFGEKSTLINHYLVHTNYRAYKCKSCERSFKQKIHLIEHSLIHLGDRPYQCKTCYKTFKECSKLNIHLRLHTGDQFHPTFNCDICDKVFTKKGGLSSHMACHSEKSNVCEICGLAVTRKISLVLHMKNHVGLANHKCHICEKDFMRKSHLSRHLLTAHHYFGQDYL